MPETLFLASQSPRRAALIRLLGVKNVQIRPSDLIETMDSEATPVENVLRLALHKASHVADQIQDHDGVVLGADTIVCIGSEILNKPRDAKDAERMLLLLSGQTHTVYTGVALVESKTKAQHTFVESTDVTFRELGLEEIRAYIASGSPMDKAGAYGIQEDFGAVFVRRVDGDYYNVVGLPLCSLYVTLKSFAPSLFLT